MFHFFKKESFKGGETLRVDIHSHLLPIDDGVKSFDEAVAILQKFEELGFKKVIITPHIISDIYPNTKKIIEHSFLSLQEEVKKRLLQIEIDYAAEHYLDENFFSLLENGEVCLIQNKYLLFETSYTSRPLFLEEAIFEINSKGFVPMLAHPERYRYIKDMNEYKKLKELGVVFQINGNSLLGAYGKEAQKKANWLMEHGMIDFLGSDAHSLKELTKYKELLSNRKIFDKLLKRNKIQNHSL